jgi:hypothetical protein
LVYDWRGASNTSLAKREIREMSCSISGNCYKKNAILLSMRAHRFPSLFSALAGAFILFAGIVPKADAQVLVYFNFEDKPLGSVVDFTSDQTPAAGGDNNGGGIQMSTLETNFSSSDIGSVPGTLINRTVGDSDIADPGIAMGINATPSENGHWIQFQVNGTAFSSFSSLSLSFAINTQGNGFDTVAFSYSTTGPLGTFTPVGSHKITSGHGFQIITFAVPTVIETSTDAVLRLTFTGGTSSGTDLQTVIDNIQLTPEPATTASGTLAVVGLCWYRRRWLTRFLLLRRSTGRLHRTLG